LNLICLLIVDLDKTAAEFRYIKSQADADGCVCNAPKFATNMIPQDVIELSSGKSIAEFAEEFQRAMANNQDDGSDSD
jgi:hypothetical protein